MKVKNNPPLLKFGFFLLGTVIGFSSCDYYFSALSSFINYFIGHFLFFSIHKISFFLSGFLVKSINMIVFFIIFFFILMV
jgi:hypothetical protein